ncbi:MAG: hypothetical protein M3041_11845 [Acidobacteriota bacterium]|nr:hypothetical protein [Acidobacteriota bacterium]
MAAASIFDGRASAQQHLAASIARFVTPRTAAAIAGIASTITTDRSSGVTIVSAILLIFGASAVFNHLRVVSIVMVVGIMIFLLISLALTAGLALVRRCSRT